MPKRKPPADPPRAAKRPPDLLTVLLFWPFLLVQWFTRRFSTPKRVLLRLLGHPAVALAYLAVLLSIFYGWRAQRYDLRQVHAMPERSIVLDRNGEEIGRIHGERRSIVPLDQVAPEFIAAILAREDARFYHHVAVDPIGIVRALMRNLEGKREGASTITQQLASDIFQLKHGERRGQTLRQLHRKCLEVAIALRLEAAMTKDEILQAYINQINWGRQIKGVGEAARIYFEKHPAELNLSEAAMLAGIVRGPDAYNPFRSLDFATRERDTTLDRMVAERKITAELAAATKAEPLEIRPEWRRSYRESYAMDKIRRDLEVILERENIELGGLTITTTIDLRIQEHAQEALDRKLREVERGRGYPHRTRSAWLELPEEGRGAPDYLQGALVLLDNRSGGVLALVGGRDAGESAFNRAIQSRRQLGSVFKPFLYLAAFDTGLRPDTLISDGSLQPGEIRGAGNWRPRNSDGVFGGMLPASTGLIRSRNTMSIRIGNHAGLENVAQLARQVGFTTPMPQEPTAFLGSWGASPWEVATAFSVLPNDGARYRPYVIAEIKDRDGNVIFPHTRLVTQAANSGSSWSVSRILEDANTRGTGAAVRRLGFEEPSAGKTGTTNNFLDAWYAGYTSSLTCAVWVGFDTPKTTVEGGYGSTLALPIWVDVVKTATRLGYPAGQLNKPVNLVECRLCRLSGRRATGGCEADGNAYTDHVPADMVPPTHDFCPLHPARALPVGGDVPPPPPSRALPVEDSPPPARALRVDEDPPPARALPVDR